MRVILLSLMLLGVMVGVVGAELKVASLHPLLSDAARKVGGEQVVVVELMGLGDDPHRFQPTAKTLQRAEGARLYLAMGKGLEPYLGNLREILGEGRILELGQDVRPLRFQSGHEHHACCAHHHDEGTVDPHWWHSLKAWQRVSLNLARAFARLDPEHKASYQARAMSWRQELQKLEAWAEERLNRVPEEGRILATTHAAFGYLCRDFGWQMIPLQGLNREQGTHARATQETTQALREGGVRVLFPDEGGNPKALEVMARQLGLKVGPALYADNSAESVEQLFRHNVQVLHGALAVDVPRAEVSSPAGGKNE